MRACVRAPLIRSGNHRIYCISHNTLHRNSVEHIHLGCQGPKSYNKIVQNVADRSVAELCTLRNSEFHNFWQADLAGANSGRRVKTRSMASQREGKIGRKGKSIQTGKNGSGWLFARKKGGLPDAQERRGAKNGRDAALRFLRRAAPNIRPSGPRSVSRGVRAPAFVRRLKVTQNTKGG